MALSPSIVAGASLELSERLPRFVERSMIDRSSLQDRGRTVLRDCVVMAIFATFLIPFACRIRQEVRKHGAPAAPPIPTQPPDEANRVHHVSGFSIITPPDWTALTSGRFMMAPLSKGEYAKRSKGLITVTSLGRKKPAGIEFLRRTTFQGREAREGMGVVREYSFDDGAFSRYALYFQHDDDWYEVTYGIAEERTVLPEMVRRYLETLRWDVKPPGSTPKPR